MKSVNAHNFAHVPSVNIPRSSFHSPFGLKTAFNSNFLIPLFWKNVLPADSWSIDANFFGRLSTPIVPFLDNVRMSVFYFYVPNRLLWDHWENFCGAQENPGDQTDYIVPQIQFGSDGCEFESLFDYMGLPPKVALKEMSLPFRAYNLIWNEWFRCTYLQDTVPVPKGDGPDNPNDFKLLKRNKRFDFWTSALPTPQRGSGVELPISGNASVYGDGYGLLMTSKLDSFSNVGRMYENGNGDVLGGVFVDGRIGTTNKTATDVWDKQLSLGVPTKAFMDQNPSLHNHTGLIADLSNVHSATINSLRQAFQLQKLLEKDNLFGFGRFTEILFGHFGVISPDARLQRPEYLGGHVININVNAVAQTSATSSISPQGNLAAVGTIAHSGRAFRKSFVEHGIIMALACVDGDLNYQQGIDPAWSYRRRFDWYWPSLSHIGEQSVALKTIYAQGTSADDTVFGYQERYAEWRYNNNLITGKMRSTCPTSLDVWHLAQKFDSAPTLSSDFIESNLPLKRVLAVQDEPEFILDCYFDVNAIRPLPTYGTPGLIDHF